MTTSCRVCSQQLISRSVARSTPWKMRTESSRRRKISGLFPAVDQSERSEEYALEDAYRKLEETEDLGFVAISEASENLLDDVKSVFNKAELTGSRLEREVF